MFHHSSGTENAVDAAILHADHPDISAYRKRGEIPFDFERRRLSIIVEQNGEPLLISKGAPESVLRVCSTYEADGQHYPLDQEARARCQQTHQQLSAQQEDFRPTDEQDMVLLGFLTFLDPPTAVFRNFEL